MISEDDIAAIRQRAENATPGPWVYWKEDGKTQFGGSFIQTKGEDLYVVGASDEDRDFIAHARQDVPRLLDELIRLRALAGEL